MSTVKVKKPSRRRQADRSDETITALRKSALDIIVNEGIEYLKLHTVAERAGYSRGIVNYHFGSKAGLLGDMLRFAALSSTNFFAKNDVRGIQAIGNMFDAMSEQYRREPEQLLGLLILINEASSSSDPNLQALVSEYDKQVRANIASVIEVDDRVTESTNAIDVEDKAKIILSLIRGVGSQWLVERESFDIISILQIIKSRLPALLDV